MVRPVYALLMLVGLWLALDPPPILAGSNDMRVETVVVVTSTGRHTFKAEIADTGPLRRRGLMFRSRMAADEGMLFDNGVDQQMVMWMKNTLISLDMVFFTKEGTIVSVAKNAVPHSEETISSGVAVRGVLEVIAGTVERLKIKPGDRLEHSLFR